MEELTRKIEKEKLVIQNMMTAGSQSAISNVDVNNNNIIRVYKL